MSYFRPYNTIELCANDYFRLYRGFELNVNDIAVFNVLL